ncbi:MAG TPA: hypothetical protein VEB22_03000 [Phycisphaerales bacterium]|nr:hypothetical protein [Phycisphaerales bacterium]
MILKRVAWTAWALIPVAALAYHFGPGQRSYIEDRAGDLLSQARTLGAAAEQAQDAAYQAHLAALRARRTALETKTPEAAAAAKAAADAEDASYAHAAAAWTAAADKLKLAHDMLSAAGSARAQTVRIARNRALIRAGEIGEGVGDLELMLDTLADTGQSSSELADQAREEAATGYYYGARLLRSVGKPASEWREVSGQARQNFRYLAETAETGAAGPRAAERQKNLELVLNLEQSSDEDLVAKPLPKNSPRRGGEGLRPGNRAGKTKRPPRRRDDARGAGGVGDIPGGW